MATPHAAVVTAPDRLKGGEHADWIVRRPTRFVDLAGLRAITLPPRTAGVSICIEGRAARCAAAGS
jgi:hypothetical protein